MIERNALCRIKTQRSTKVRREKASAVREGGRRTEVKRKDEKSTSDRWSLYFDRAARRPPQSRFDRTGRAKPKQAEAWLEAGKRTHFTRTKIIIRALRLISLTDSFNIIIYFLLKQNYYYNIRSLRVLSFSL